MKLPEWRPLPPHLNHDDDTKDAGASLALIVPALLVVAGFSMLLFGVFR